MLHRSSRSKKIASNTFVLFIRMFVLMVVNLYAVRLLLNGLGQTDYGLFNTVAGVVTTTFFLSSILAFSIQRFYSIALGRADNELFRKVYSVSLNIVVLSSIVIFIVLETLGAWFVSNFLSIPMERFDVTMLVFHFSVFTFVFSFIQVPFLAAIYANEDMNVFSIISTIEAILRLAASWMVSRVVSDGLWFYGLSLMLISFLVSSAYTLYAIWKYSGCSYVIVRDRHMYTQLLSFSGWYTFGTMANTGMNQCNTVLLNVYFGPIVTAAFSVASQIQNAFNSLCNSMVLPFRPAMIKAYAEGNHKYVCRMFVANNKVICFFMLMISIPIIYEMDAILSFWLGGYDNNTLCFSRLTVICVILISLHNPISIIMHAVGKVKQYHLPVESTILLCCPITWMFFHYGLPSYILYYVIIVLVIIAHIIRLICLKKYYAYFSLKEYVVAFVCPALCVTISGILVMLLIHQFVNIAYIRIIFSFFVFPITFIILFYYIGLDKKERVQVKDIVYSVIHRQR